MKTRKGSAYLFVILIFLFVSLFSMLIITQVQQTVYETHAYALQMQAYYMTQRSADATLAILMADDNALLKSGDYPKTDTLSHWSGSGTSVIKLTKEIHPYYSEQKVWVIVSIETRIPDPRGRREGEAFLHSGKVMILVENPIVQLYYLNPDAL